MDVRFFKSPARFHDWLEKNHDKVSELWVGFHKKGSGKPSITYPEALDEALCFGWIDGVRQSLDESSYTIRFTLRKPKSIWSNVNTKRATVLKKLGRMKPSGLKAFAAREDKRSGVYSFENAPRELDEVYAKRFRANKKAWDFFAAQPPFFKRTVAFWIMSAKKEETRLRRLDGLMRASEKGERLTDITGASKKPPSKA
jgi:uncharacterized protein YdeI (YjbR/CyaY-like superfamily)